MYLFALDYGRVYRDQDGQWVEDPNAHVDPGWLASLRSVGLSPVTNKPDAPAEIEGNELRVAPLNMHPQISWFAKAGADPDALALQAFPPGDPDWGAGSQTYSSPHIPGWAKWAGSNLVWDGLKWIAKNAWKGIPLAE